MKKTQKNPPSCPGCGKPLQTVRWEVDSDLYKWDGKGYTLANEGAGYTRCPHCDADLSELFPDGPVNY